MKPTNLTIKDLFTDNTKLTFLVGAGCSIDPPSCLPAGRKMIEAIINYTCAKSEKKKILEVEELRFEQLVEIVRDLLDPKLKIIDYYGQCDTPNLHHFFLAEMIQKGNFVLTTNFDFLIEYALLQSGIPKEEIIPVITRKDFLKYKNPNEIFKHGKKVLYKIHGSTKNIITEESTRESLIATIQAFGANKEVENVFQLEPFKKPAFSNLTTNRSLVVMGYSGSDDFDIVPTLKILQHIQDIIWINHKNDDGGKELIYEIDMEAIEDYENLEKVNQILVDISRMKYANRVLRIDINTLRMVRELTNIHPKINSELISIDIDEWLSNNIKSPDIFMKYQIPYKIYNVLDIYNDAIRCSKEILNLAKNLKNQEWINLALTNIGGLNYEMGNYSEALNFFEQALANSKELIFEKKLKFEAKELATILNNISLIKKAQKNYIEALNYCVQAIHIDEKFKNFSGKAIALNNMGLIYFEQAKYLDALKCYNAALEIFDKLGDLSGKATVLTSIGGIYTVRKNFSEALRINKIVSTLTEKLGDFTGQTTCLSNIAFIYYLQNKYQNALKYCKQLLIIANQINDKLAQAIGNDLIGNIYYKLNKKYDSLKHLQRALTLYIALGMKDKEKEMQFIIKRINR